MGVFYYRSALDKQCTALLRKIAHFVAEREPSNTSISIHINNLSAYYLTSLFPIQMISSRNNQLPQRIASSRM